MALSLPRAPFAPCGFQPAPTPPGTVLRAQPAEWLLPCVQEAHNVDLLDYVVLPPHITMFDHCTALRMRCLGLARTEGCLPFEVSFPACI